MPRDVEHIFICLVGIFMSSLKAHPVGHSIFIHAICVLLFNCLDSNTSPDNDLPTFPPKQLAAFFILLKASAAVQELFSSLV